MAARSSQLQEATLAEVATRVANRLGGEVDRQLVAAVVRQCAEDFAGARLLQYVPVFVERRSTERLKQLLPDNAKARAS